MAENTPRTGIARHAETVVMNNARFYSADFMANGTLSTSKSI